VYAYFIVDLIVGINDGEIFETVGGVDCLVKLVVGITVGILEKVTVGGNEIELGFEDNKMGFKDGDNDEIISADVGDIDIGSLEEGNEGCKDRGEEEIGLKDGDEDVED
jgi:hypothetical protein